MSDLPRDSIDRLIAAIDRLTIATDRLTSQLQGRNPTPVAATAPGTVVEGARTPFPTEFQSFCALYRFRGVEDGPGRLPQYVYTYTREKLSNKEPGPDKRAEHAFQSGFWAAAAIDTHTPYNPAVGPSGLRQNHWVVLRSAHPGPFRTTSKRDFLSLAGAIDQNTVYGVFDSLTEAEIFCLAAQTPVPPLKTC